MSGTPAKPYPKVSSAPVPTPAALSDADLLDRLQRAAFDYFIEQYEPSTGLIADTSRPNAPSSIAVVGFGLTAFPIGVERGWMTRDDAVARTLTTLRFFTDSDQRGAPTGTGYKGFYYHFLDPRSGRREWQSEESLIDTPLLLAGALTAA